MKIQITLRSVYGTDQAYPVCEHAKTFAEIANSKTLTPATLRKIARLGYEIEVVAMGVTLGRLAA